MNYLFIFLVFAFLFIIIDFIYNKIILKFIIVKYKTKHDKLICEFKKYKLKEIDNKEEKKAIELLDKLLKSHSNRLETDNLRVLFTLKNRIKNDPNLKHKYQSEANKNKAILDNAPNELRHFFNQSVDIAKTTLVFNSLFDILLFLIFFVLPIFVVVIFMGVLGKSFNKLKPYRTTKDDWILVS